MIVKEMDSIARVSAEVLLKRMFAESVMVQVLDLTKVSAIVMETHLMFAESVVETEFQQDGPIVTHHQKMMEMNLEKTQEIKSKKELKKMVVNITTLGSE